MNSHDRAAGPSYAKGAPLHPARAAGGAPQVTLVGASRCVPGEDWRDRALCAETDPEAFFPEKGASTREAKMVCQGCEVRAECLAYALERREQFGIWGGLSEPQRRRLLRGAA